MIQIYYNSKCGKCRHALQVLKQAGHDVEVVEYLKDTPSIAELSHLIALLGITPHDLIRTKEALYIEKFKGKVFADAEWIKILHQHPILIERPIIVNKACAVIARSEEKLEEILS